MLTWTWTTVTTHRRLRCLEEACRRRVGQTSERAAVELGFLLTYPREPPA